MKKEDKEFLQTVVDNEGFDYAFLYYSSFIEIEDKEFHKLRKEYVKAAENLEKYLNIDF